MEGLEFLIVIAFFTWCGIFIGYQYRKWRVGKKLKREQANELLPHVSGSFSRKKLLHNFCYWTNPFYMLSTDLKNMPKAQEFIVEHFGHILEPIIKWLAKILDKFERRK